jgi:hypothetical protein
MSSHLLSKNVKIRILRTIILPVVLYGHKTWFLTLRALETKVLKRIFGPWRDEVTGGRGNNITKSYATYILRQV